MILLLKRRVLPLIWLVCYWLKFSIFIYVVVGLVAILLYHDGRRCLLSALRTLLQSREGLTWTLELDEEMSELVMNFTKQMIDDGNLNF